MNRSVDEIRPTYTFDVSCQKTVPEAIIAAQAGIKVLGFSVVTNLSNIFHNKPHSQEEIWENARKGREKLEIIIKNIVNR